MSLEGKILITGGAGTLGQAIVRAAGAERWNCTFTIFNRDVYKQFAMRRAFPGCRYVLGDIRDPGALAQAFAGHDLVIHAAAQKHIPESERQPVETYRINVDGSLNVLRAAAEAGVRDVILVSTDKVCHPVNAYGATKLLMERAAQEFALSAYGQAVRVHLVRYGNVLGSNGSVLQIWERQYASSRTLSLTNRDMTRFWLTEAQAVQLIEYAATKPAGTVLIPKLGACSMDELAQALYPEATLAITGLRPGEKMHEEMLTEEERPHASEYDDHFLLWPVCQPAIHSAGASYTSNTCRRMTADEIRSLAGK